MAIDHTGLKPTLMSLLVLLMYSIYVAKQPVSGADPGGAQGASVPPLKKNCAEKSRYSNREVTLIKQSHDHEAVHNRLTMGL